MKVLYLYNEILPKRSAHDVYIWRNCIELASVGAKVTLAVGKGSDNDISLHQHYQTQPHSNFQVVRLPILRKNFSIPLTWNRIFFHAAQTLIKETIPDWVLMSVRKQASYHLTRRVPNVRYAYEVHELLHYAGEILPSSQLNNEIEYLNACNLVTATTIPLTDILRQTPYKIDSQSDDVPVIELVPLASKTSEKLPTLSYSKPFKLGYVGQLYRGQGMELLIDALSRTNDVTLKVIGGDPLDIKRLQEFAMQLDVADRIEWMGFRKPAELARVADDIHAFVAPFSSAGRMPYVAHTKLVDYIAWGRPFIAPNMTVVTSHLHSLCGGCSLFLPDNAHSLADAITAMNEEMAYKNAATIAASSEWRSAALSWEKRSIKLINALRNRMSITG